MKQKMTILKWMMVMFVGSVIFASHVNAQQLPCMAEAPWGGFFSGYQRHGFEFGMNNEGVGEIYLMAKSKKRIGESRKVKILTEVIVVSAGGKRSVAAINSDEGFNTAMEPGLKHKEIKYTAKTKKGTEVEVVIRYKGNKLVWDAKVLDRGKVKQGEIYASFKVVVPAMYGKTYEGDEKKSKARMRKDKIKFVRALDRKSVSLKSYEDVDLSADEMAKGGVTSLFVKMEAQEGRSFNFGTLDRKGVLQFENKKPKTKGKLWQGYSVRWVRKMGDEKASPLVIEVK